MNTNIVIISGNVVKDPEFRTTQNGVSLVNFSIAHRSNRKDANGEFETDFFPCVAWRGTADVIYKYIKKGTRITVNGKIANDKYTDKEGKTRYSTYINVGEIDFTLPANRNDKKGEPKADIPEPLKNFEPIESDNLPF